MSDNAVIYNPSATLVPFLTCEAFISLISGPVGSGKSSAAMMKIGVLEPLWYEIPTRCLQTPRFLRL